MWLLKEPVIFFTLLCALNYDFCPKEVAFEKFLQNNLYNKHRFKNNNFTHTFEDIKQHDHIHFFFIQQAKILKKGKKLDFVWYPWTYLVKLNWKMYN